MSELLERPDDWDAPVAIPDLSSVARILVPFDGSHTAERALAWAKLIATPTGAEIIVMTAYEPPLTKKGRGVLYVDDVSHALAQEAEELAAEAVSLLIEQGHVARGLIVKGEAAAAILDSAETEEVDVVVLGRRGLTSELAGLSGSLEKFRSALHGAVTDRIVRNAETAVLVVE